MVIIGEIERKWRRMVVDKSIADLICILEYKIGKQTYNPNSYNGWTGEEGCGFKYPVNYCRNTEDLEAHRLTKTKSRIDYLAPECVGTMKYAFGSDHLYIGDGLVEVLKYLEEIYNIDFNELEQKRIQKRKIGLKRMEEEINQGKIIRVEPGTKVVGLDIPEGKFDIINLKEGYSQYLSVEIYNAEGVLIKNIFTSDSQIEIKLEDGYYTKSYDAYSLKKINCD